MHGTSNYTRKYFTSQKGDLLPRYRQFAVRCTYAANKAPFPLSTLCNTKKSISNVSALSLTEGKTCMEKSNEKKIPSFSYGVRVQELPIEM